MLIMMATIIGPGEALLRLAMFLFFSVVPPLLFGVLGAVIFRNRVVSRFVGPILAVAWFWGTCSVQGIDLVSDWVVLGLVVYFAVGFALVGVIATERFRDGLREGSNRAVGK